jgi:hypothetical protein
MAIKIGTNAAILASATALNNAAGQKIAALRRALRDVHDFQFLLGQLTDEDIKLLSFGDGTAGTSNDIESLRKAFSVADDLYTVSVGGKKSQEDGFDYDGAFRLLAAVV